MGSIPTDLLGHAINTSSFLRDHSDINHLSYNLLKTDILKWIYRNYVPHVQKFVGTAALPIIRAHIRHYSSKQTSELKSDFCYEES